MAESRSSPISPNASFEGRCKIPVVRALTPLPRIAVAGLLTILTVASACGPKKPTLPTAAPAPKYPNYPQPTVPAALADSPAAAVAQRGWDLLQAGDLKGAERELTAATRLTPGFFPAEASLGYVSLARTDARQAVEHFDRALESDARYVPALLGRGEALLTLNREDDASAAFEAAVAADPSLTEIARCVEVLKFRGAEQNLAAARQAARSGNLDDAGRRYATAIVRSPDSAFLYRELGAVERRKGEVDAALADFRHAVMLDPTDAGSLVQIGDILDGRGEFEEAVKTYNDALALEANPDVEAKIENVQARAELARRPEEYRAIETTPEITRGELAALIGVRLGPLVQAAPRRDAVVITDVRAHWATTWIMNVSRAGVMEPYANHTFQPQAVVRRAD